MFTAEKIRQEKKHQSGSALVIALIVLVILAALGYAGLEVADLNIFSSANDRDAKSAFLHADSGVNIGIAYLQTALEDANSSFYRHDANIWQNSTESCPDDTAANPLWSKDHGVSSCVPCNDSATTLKLYSSTAPMATYVRAGKLNTNFLEGSAAHIGTGYEGAGKSISKGGFKSDYLIRSRRYGDRNSLAEVDSAWREIHR